LQLGKLREHSKDQSREQKEVDSKCNQARQKRALHKQLGVSQGEKIPTDKLAAAAKKGGKVGQRARLAMTLKKLKKK
jgi:hypothetical protein